MLLDNEGLFNNGLKENWAHKKENYQWQGWQKVAQERKFKAATNIGAYISL